MVLVPMSVMFPSNAVSYEHLPTIVEETSADGPEYVRFQVSTSLF